MKAIVIVDAHFNKIYNEFEMIYLELSKGNKLIVPGDFSDDPENITTLQFLKQEFSDLVKIFPGNHDDNYVSPKGILSSCLYDSMETNYINVLNAVKRSASYEFLDKIIKESKDNFDEGKLQTFEIEDVKILAYHSAPPIFNKKEFRDTLWERFWNDHDKKHKYRKLKKVIQFLEKNQYNGLVRGHDHTPLIAIKRKDEKNLEIHSLNGEYIKKFFKTEKLNNKTVLDKQLTITKEDYFIFNPGAYQEGFYGIIEEEGNEIKLSVNNFYSKLEEL